MILTNNSNGKVKKYYTYSISNCSAENSIYDPLSTIKNSKTRQGAKCTSNANPLRAH